MSLPPSRGPDIFQSHLGQKIGNRGCANWLEANLSIDLRKYDVAKFFALFLVSYDLVIFHLNLHDDGDNICLKYFFKLNVEIHRSANCYM